MSQARRFGKALGLGRAYRAAQRVARRGGSSRRIEQASRRDDEHLRMLMAFVLEEDSDCIDVGTGVGEVLAEMVRLAPRGRHLGFDPLPGHVAETAQRCPGADVRQVALSDAAGHGSFVHVVNMPAFSGLRARPYPAGAQTTTIEVEIRTLDDELPAGMRPRLMKIDVEGAELSVLRGASKTLEQHSPTIVFEHGEPASAAYGDRSVDLHRFLSELGYRIFDMEGRGPLASREFCEAWQWNFVAHR
jgi:FkbM family methyltransferase